MPPRSSLTSQFSIADSNNEVVCPLRNQDGSSCRKRCIGEKRYRSMQEHIRRAHPEHYIQKLPATEESFLLMINTDPSTRHPQQPPQSNPTSAPSSAFPPFQGFGIPPVVDRLQGFHHDRQAYDSSTPATPRHTDDYTAASLLPAASAAAALAQLHGHRVEQDWEAEHHQDWASEAEGRRIPRSPIELPPIHMSPNDITSDPFPPMNSNRPRDILPSILANSPPGRSSTLPPIQRSVGPNRPRKQSVTKRGREAHHKKQKSRGSANDWLRRIQNDERLRPGGHDRKALSAEPAADYGKRWEDLIDAADQAASAAGDVDEDRTPVPQSPVSIPRASLPPFTHTFRGDNYQASPLQQALTPPSHNQDTVVPFPSVEGGEGGENFHIEPLGLSDSSPNSSQKTEIYCAACQSVSKLKESYACTECICGLCQACVDVLMAEQGARRKCPRCATIGGRFKPFQLDIR
ncbi:hypothetical protein ACRALDRAFT_1062596 [Sodiomyces alcalophilus JCM 7366]|uniref:uncharacterized protein n=1 Tax=Sodiomyces alcalophilus JCM 7366 TaxID=591952 RepID=UPI0039B45D17